MIITYHISELVPYINWVYYFYAWQVKDDAEKQRMQQEALAKLSEINDKYHVYAVFELFDANSDGDDIVLANSKRIPCLRQQQGNPPYLSLADFISPVKSQLGLFATSADIGLETDFDDDVYLKMMMQLLADRLAEY